MPVQIRELHVRVTVNPGEGDTGATATPQGSIPQDSQMPDKQMLIAECVEQVMELLNEKMEP